MDIDFELDAINKVDLGTYSSLPLNVGKTQSLIDALCDAIVEGQPKAWVWAHTHDFAVNNIQPKVLKALKQRGLTIDKCVSGKIDVEGSVIIFSGVCNIRKRYGYSGYGDFVDHYVYDFI